MEYVLETNAVTKRYRSFTVLNGLTMRIPKGSVYGFVGRNGAGKTTLIRIICGLQEPTDGSYTLYGVKNTESAVLRNRRRMGAVVESPAIYLGMTAKENIRQQYNVLGIPLDEGAEELLRLVGLDKTGSKTARNFSLGMRQRLGIAVALAGNPDFLVLDEPTNGLDINAVTWLEDFLADYFGTVLVVSHDRHFLNNVCTNIVDIDYGAIKMYVGNYEFWYESSQLMQRLIKQQNKKNEDKIKELQTFISRFSANKSKSRQATSRRKLLDKLTVEEMPASSRRYPFIGFEMDREAGKDILSVSELTKSEDGRLLFDKLNFTVAKGDKIAFVGNEPAITALFRILMEETEADSGSFKWGISITKSYFPHDNTAYFNGCTESILDWMRKYSKDQTETYLRGFLGRMLFSNDSVFKPVNVLSGGEKVRCMFSRMMLFGSNVLILDQPTDHLDLESITAVNNGLQSFRGNVLFTSHDYEIVNTVANRIIEIRGDGSWTDRTGNYDDFVAYKKQLGCENITL